MGRLRQAGMEHSSVANRQKFRVHGHWHLLTGSPCLTRATKHRGRMSLLVCDNCRGQRQMQIVQLNAYSITRQAVTLAALDNWGRGLVCNVSCTR